MNDKKTERCNSALDSSQTFSGVVNNCDINQQSDCSPSSKRSIKKEIDSAMPASGCSDGFCGIDGDFDSWLKLRKLALADKKL
jgi:hypothetical protein